jgi:hypothetical protein
MFPMELVVWFALRAERKREEKLKKRTLLSLAPGGFPKLPTPRPEPKTPAAEIVSDFEAHLSYFLLNTPYSV